MNRQREQSLRCIFNVSFEVLGTVVVECAHETSEAMTGGGGREVVVAFYSPPEDLSYIDYSILLSALRPFSPSLVISSKQNPNLDK
jgi:hypothetical protein